MSRIALHARDFDAVVIGTSAGGIEALSTLLSALPADFKAPVFIVLHLPREKPSLLVNIFSPRCALTLREAMDKDPIEQGTIYFAPPDYHLLIDRGPDNAAILALSADDAVNFSRPSIDVLFESAVDVYHERLLGIILTGGNNDGADGLQAIHEANGITIVQDPNDAQASLMPQSALAQVDADFVLSVPEIASLLQATGGAA